MAAAEANIRVNAAAVRRHLEVLYDLAIEDAEDLNWPNATYWRDSLPLVTEARAKTYLAALVTGLVARSMYSSVDATALRADAHPGGYSAPTVWKVFYEFAGDKGLDIRGLGPAPLNNNPFLNKGHVRHDWPGVRDQSGLSALATLLAQANSLPREDAERVVVLLIQNRLAVSPSAPPAAMTREGLGLREFTALAHAADTFTKADPEGGRRGQAFVAACLSMAFERVESEKVNDPSRRHPGDVRAFRDGKIVCYAEAKQKPVVPADIRRFVRLVGGAHCAVSLYAALAPGQRPEGLSAAGDDEGRTQGVLSLVYTDGWTLARDCAAFSRDPAEFLAARFDSSFLHWLSALSVGPQTLPRWTHLRDSALTRIHRPSR